jgi:dienelactone hydrolase
MTRLEGYTASDASYEGAARTIFRRGEGPGVIVIHEVPGITPEVADFGRRVADAGFTALLPRLFGRPGKKWSWPYTIGSLVRACVSREFYCMATRRSSPVTNWLRAMARDVHAELGGPGVGVVGMCLTGGFGLAMMADESVVAPVLSQPAAPFPIGTRRKASLGLSDQELERVVRRADACPVLGLRFTEDTSVPGERFATLRAVLGERFTAVEIDSAEGNPHGIKKSAHSVLTAELVDEPGHPTRDALDQVLAFLTTRLK